MNRKRKVMNDSSTEMESQTSPTDEHKINILVQINKKEEHLIYLQEEHLKTPKKTIEQLLEISLIRNEERKIKTSTPQSEPSKYIPLVINIPLGCNITGYSKNLGCILQEIPNIKRLGFKTNTFDLSKEDFTALSRCICSSNSECFDFVFKYLPNDYLCILFDCLSKRETDFKLIFQWDPSNFFVTNQHIYGLHPCIASFKALLKSNHLKGLSSITPFCSSEVYNMILCNLNKGITQLELPIVYSNMCIPKIVPYLKDHQSLREFKYNDLCSYSEDITQILLENKSIVLFEPLGGKRIACFEYQLLCNHSISSKMITFVGCPHTPSWDFQTLTLFFFERLAIPFLLSIKVFQKNTFKRRIGKNIIFEILSRIMKKYCCAKHLKN